MQNYLKLTYHCYIDFKYFEILRIDIITLIYTYIKGPASPRLDPSFLVFITALLV